MWKAVIRNLNRGKVGLLLELMLLLLLKELVLLVSKLVRGVHMLVKDGTTGTRQHAGMVSKGNGARLARPVAERLLPYDSLVVTLALTLRFKTITASRPLFATLDAPFAAC